MVAFLLPRCRGLRVVGGVLLELAIRQKSKLRWCGWVCGGPLRHLPDLQLALEQLFEFG
jgi:hypothetical protein